MKKQYESTIEEAVHAQYRLAEISGILTTEKRVMIATVIVTSLLGYFLLPVAHLHKVVIITIVFIISIVLVPLTYKRIFQKRVRRILIKALGTEKPVSCEYEMDGKGLVFRKMGQELHFSWSGAKQLIETNDSIELIMEPTAIAIIPKHIFENPEEQQEWVDFIKSHANNL